MDAETPATGVGVFAGSLSQFERTVVFSPTIAAAGQARPVDDDWERGSSVSTQDSTVACRVRVLPTASTGRGDRVGG